MKKLLNKIPIEIKYLIGNFLILYILLLLFRLVFYLFFFQTNIHNPSDIIKAWYIGAKFDLRLTLILLLPIFILLMVFKRKSFIKPQLKRTFTIYFFIIEFGLICMYATDLGFYAYLGHRIDPTILRFVNWGDAGTNLRMVWESYPVIKGLIIFIIIMFILVWLHHKLYTHFSSRSKEAKFLEKAPGRRRTFTITAIVVFILMAGGIYGNFDYYPLQWSQALFTQDEGISSLGLNPVLNFFNKLKFYKDTYNIAKVKKYYPFIANYLGIKNSNPDSLIFTRHYDGDSTRPKPNIVFVMLESTGAAVSSMFGNPMQPTPNMQQLSEQGILFKNFYVPAHSTAKTVFALITGLPDITHDRPASSHSNMIDQRVIMNEFKGYQKYYFLGGNMNWEDIRALFTTNIKGVKLYEEKDFNAKKLDVWGISDYDLVLSATKVFDSAWRDHKPFVAFLQLADNHKPYSTTSGSGDFKRWSTKDIDKQKFDSSGFISLDQLNALRYEDYNVGKLMELAKQSGYLQNTIFVLFGDHNCSLRPYHFMPLPEYEMGTGQLHVTAFIYAPEYFKPAVISEPASLLDLFPTMAHYVGMPFTNYTLGVNLFDSSRKEKYDFLYFIKNSKVYSGIIGNRFLYELSTDHTDSGLYDLQNDPLKNIAASLPDTASYLNNLLKGFYQSTRYLFFNNKNPVSK